MGLFSGARPPFSLTNTKRTSNYIKNYWCLKKSRTKFNLFFNQQKIFNRAINFFFCQGPAPKSLNLAQLTMIGIGFKGHPLITSGILPHKHAKFFLLFFEIQESTYANYTSRSKTAKINEAKNLPHQLLDFAEFPHPDVGNHGERIWVLKTFRSLRFYGKLQILKFLWKTHHWEEDLFWLKTEIKLNFGLQMHCATIAHALRWVTIRFDEFRFKSYQNFDSDQISAGSSSFVKIRFYLQNQISNFFVIFFVPFKNIDRKKKLWKVEKSWFLKSPKNYFCSKLVTF